METAAHELGQKLEQRTCLLVIDDVWDAAHLQPFLKGGKGCARLFTTRDASIASEAQAVNVDEMRQSEAVALQVQGVRGLQTGAARELASQLGEWPLALELAAAMMRGRVRQGDSVAHAAKRLAKIVERKGVGALENPTAADQRHRTISSVLEVSLDLLDAAGRERLAALSIFPEDVAIPLAAAASVWQLDEDDSEDLAQRMARLSLLKLDLERSVLRLHDVMRDWLSRDQRERLPALHNRLVNSWPDWRNLPELPGEYAWRWLPWHLACAGRKPEIEALLWDPLWMVHKLTATDTNALAADYEYLNPSPEAELLRGALRLSANVLAGDAKQFASQMVGRLLPYQESPKIQSFLSALSAIAPECWLRPMYPALHPPGTGLVRTLEGHADDVYGVAVTPDGRKAVSASKDETLKVWDLETGRALRTLEGHSAPVWGVAVTPDGQWAVSASWDKTLKVWDLETGRALRTLEGHSDQVFGVAVTPDGRRAVSGSQDGTLKMWDLETGRELWTRKGHSDCVTGVAVALDGHRAVSTSGERTLKVWDLETGSILRTLEGHSASVESAAVTPDGQRAVSASRDDTLKVWDLGVGRAPRVLERHAGSIYGLAVRPDGRQAVSASRDCTLKVWDLETGRAVQTLKGHSSYAAGVAVTRDSRHAVSASYDHTLKVWDLETGRELRMLAGHTDAVLGVAVTPDGQRAVSAPEDQTLKVWDLETGHELCTLEGHTSAVSGVAVTQDGRRAVSASYDDTLRVWDLETGCGLRALQGHSSWVLSLAVTPDGQRAVSVSGDQTLKVWDLATGRELRTLKGHSRAANGVAVTPDGRRAVSASDDKTLKVWDLETASPLATFTCDAVVYSCAFANNKKIVAGDAAGRLHFLLLEERTPADTGQAEARPTSFWRRR
ncbi:MAG TPA: NB-ARC domain-containing protein [Bryobacteraceae bacterium]